jgi:hypothetical protein
MQNRQPLSPRLAAHVLKIEKGARKTLKSIHNLLRELEQEESERTVPQSEEEVIRPAKRSKGDQVVPDISDTPTTTPRSNSSSTTNQ